MFETSLVSLVRDGRKVTGVIAETPEGYVRINVSKGVVLATGGYAGNPEMMNTLQPHTVGVLQPIVESNNSGDGIKACLWMGAVMDETHSTMMFDRGALLPDETPATTAGPGFHVLGSQPFLKVNLLGKRFMNESCPYDFTLHAQAMQPGHCCVEVYDANFMADVERFSTVGCSRVYPYPNGAPANNPPEALQGMLDSLIEKGYIQQADTLEELADKLGIPADEFVRTCNRYNELYDAQEDTDFYKEAYRLSEMRTAPFYGVRMAGFLLATMDGIRIDEYMRPIDENHEPFEGIYLVGDCSGGYYSGSYPNLYTGHACGRTLTFARRVARILSGQLDVG